MFNLGLFFLTVLVKQYACYNKDLGQTSNCHRNKRAHPAEIFTELYVVTRTSVQTG